MLTLTVTDSKCAVRRTSSFDVFRSGSFSRRDCGKVGANFGQVRDWFGSFERTRIPSDQYRTGWLVRGCPISVNRELALSSTELVLQIEAARGSLLLTSSNFRRGSRQAATSCETPASVVPGSGVVAGL